jgi:hypothetical protein
MVFFCGKAYRHAVFITHNWGEDELGRNNHDRAKRINEALKKNGIETWFDEDRMQGDTRQKMLQGIDDSALVLVLVTKKYASKVNGANQSDNCATEFRYVLDTKEQADMILPIVMEPCMHNPKTWGGKLQAGVGHLLYKDFSSDDDAGWAVAVAGLVKQLRDVLATGHAKAGQADHVVLTVAIDPEQMAREQAERAARAAEEEEQRKKNEVGPISLGFMFFSALLVTVVGTVSVIDWGVAIGWVFVGLSMLIWLGVCVNYPVVMRRRRLDAEDKARKARVESLR